MPLNPGVADILASPGAPTIVQNALGTGGAVTYTIVAVNAAGQDSVPSPATTTPANTVATNVNVTLSWSPVPGAVQYRIIRNGKYQAVVNGGQTSYTDNAAIGSTTYVANTVSPAALVPSAVSPVDGGKNTYRASARALASAASCTNLFTISGSAVKTIRITRLEISGQQTTAAAAQLRVIIQSAADTGGTATNPAAVPHDSTSPAATATINAYTANPTPGTAVGDIYAGYVFLAAPGTATVGSDKLVFDYGNRPAQAIVLRGAAQVLAVNLNGVTVTGGAFDINVEWSED